MSRTVIPFSVPDISALARSLREQLAGCDHLPGHLELLNMLARSAGQRNFQSLRAQQAAQQRLAAAPEPQEPVDYVQLQHAARHFDLNSCLVSWPARQSLQTVCLWVLWSQLPARESLAEPELNRLLRRLHMFGDHALLRRELCDQELLSRTANGSEYRRVERRPPAQAEALIHHLSARSARQGAA